MKKLKRLNLNELRSEVEVLPEDVLRLIFGGEDYWMCVFDGMGYLSNLYGGCNDGGYWVDNYGGSYAYDDNGNKTGLYASDAIDYITSNFDASVLESRDIYGVLTSGGRLFTSMPAGNGNWHAVIIHGYADNGNFVGVDATTGASVNLTHNQINAEMLVGVTGAFH